MDKKALAFRSLTGLSVGDAFGEMFFGFKEHGIQEKQLPAAPWRWTDDTHMALSIVDVLIRRGEIVQDDLVARFVDHYQQEPARGYGGGAHRLLSQYSAGADWRVEASSVFEGGSYGNGAAMRAAPIGAYYFGEPDRAAEEAKRSAVVTHTHIEGWVGAMAVAVAAAIFRELSGRDLLREIAIQLPSTLTKDRIEQAINLDEADTSNAASLLGTGQEVAAFDTVPFCLWVAAHFGHDYEEALWATVSGLGDRDTTCAIVGGIVVIKSDVPSEWIRRRENLPGYPHL